MTCFVEVSDGLAYPRDIAKVEAVLLGTDQAGRANLDDLHPQHLMELGTALSCELFDAYKRTAYAELASCGWVGEWQHDKLACSYDCVATMQRNTAAGHTAELHTD